jgi:hypothetical protein
MTNLEQEYTKETGYDARSPFGHRAGYVLWLESLVKKQGEDLAQLREALAGESRTLSTSTETSRTTIHISESER